MDRRDLVFEIGVEEMPSAPLYAAIEQLRADAPKALDAARLSYDELAVHGSPRRLVVRVAGMAVCQEERDLKLKGPSAKAAFDAQGNPTKAAEGFARGKGIDVGTLVVEEGEGGAYVYAHVHESGAAALDVLPDLLTGLINGLNWPKAMRWGSGEARFIRPVRWLLALFGEDVVKVSFAGIPAGRVTRGHRFLHPEPIEVAAAVTYAEALTAGRVLLDENERATVLREGIERAAAAAGGAAVVPEKTFAEVVNLVEFPTVATGAFDEAFLEVPREVLENAMESHQRYFPVEDAQGGLLPRFIVAHNGDPRRTEAIVHGHERVIRARLADAAFFYREDLAHELEWFVDKLNTITFQEKLGTLAAKMARVGTLVETLAVQAGADPAQTAHAKRAAHLAKADLVTAVVVEFPTLQGVMGRYYALAAGETPEVAAAIVEHYQPRFAGDALPPSVAGQLVAVADKLDTIVGIFAAGMPPKGSADPYALRRAALGILGIVIEQGLRLQLDEAIGHALSGYAGVVTGFDREALSTAVRDFILGRMQTVLKVKGHAYDTVDAVMTASGDDPYDAAIRAAALTPFREDEAAADLTVAFTRAKNLTQPELGTGSDRALMGTEEIALADALDGARDAYATAMDERDYAGALGVLAGLRAPIDDFFDAVLVMDPDEALKANRLKLLNDFVGLFARFADFSKLVG